ARPRSDNASRTTSWLGMERASCSVGPRTRYPPQIRRARRARPRPPTAPRRRLHTGCLDKHAAEQLSRREAVTGTTSAARSTPGRRLGARPPASPPVRRARGARPRPTVALRGRLRTRSLGQQEATGVEARKALLRPCQAARGTPGLDLEFTRA